MAPVSFPRTERRKPSLGSWQAFRFADILFSAIPLAENNIGQSEITKEEKSYERPAKLSQGVRTRKSYA